VAGDQLNRHSLSGRFRHENARTDPTSSSPRFPVGVNGADDASRFGKSGFERELASSVGLQRYSGLRQSGSRERRIAFPSGRAGVGQKIVRSSSIRSSG
jgi:hypothetical protein